MFEAKLTEGLILKKIVDSIKDIVTDVNIDISPSGKYRLKPVHITSMPELFCSERIMRHDSVLVRMKS